MIKTRQTLMVPSWSPFRRHRVLPDGVSVITPEQPNRRPATEATAIIEAKAPVRAEGDPKDVQKMQPSAPQPVEGDAEVVTKEPVKVDRGTVAQSIVEGRLPQKTQPEQVVMPPSRTVPGGDVEPQMARSGTASGTSPEAPSKARDVATLKRQETEMARKRESPVPFTAPVTNRKTALASTTSMPPAVIGQQQAAAGPRLDLTEKVGNAIDADFAFGSVPGERATTTLMPSAPAHGASTPEAARHVAAQVAMAISNASGKTTEISLNPEELGRVRLSLTATEGTITLNVLAERPETQDLMRRHIDQLSQQFRELGYGSISFSFGGEKSDQQSPLMPEVEGVETELQEAQQVTDVPTVQLSSGVDLRL